MTEYLMSPANSLILAIWLYWVPALFCAVFYTIKTVRQYHEEKLRRDKPGDGYYPRLRVGTLLGRLLASAVPVVNLMAATFDLGPEVFRRVITVLVNALDKPLVPCYPDKRDQK